MPNWVNNEITVEQGDAKSFFEFMKSKDSPFDFNNLIPMPEALKDTCSPSRPVPDSEIEEAVKKWKQEKEKHEKNKSTEFLFNKPISVSESKGLIEKYGHDNWYDWSVNNWGTKWNAGYPQMIEDTTISFKTAWSPPEEIYHAIAKKFPDMVFGVTWEEEQGFGADCGIEEGEYYEIEAWEAPNPDEVEEILDEELEYSIVIFKLEDHPRYEDGFYIDYVSEETYCETIEEAREMAKKELG